MRVLPELKTQGAEPVRALSVKSLKISNPSSLLFPIPKLVINLRDDSSSDSSDHDDGDPIDSSIASLLKSARRTVENKDVVASKAALSHLPHNQQEEYHRLKQEIIRRESHQKMALKNGNNSKLLKVTSKVKDLSAISAVVSLADVNSISKQTPIPTSSTIQGLKSPAKTMCLETPDRTEPTEGEQPNAESILLKESEIDVSFSVPKNTTANQTNPNPTTSSLPRDPQTPTLSKVASLKQQLLLKKYAFFSLFLNI